MLEIVKNRLIEGLLGNLGELFVGEDKLRKQCAPDPRLQFKRRVNKEVEHLQYNFFQSCLLLCFVCGILQNLHENAVNLFKWATYCRNELQYFSVDVHV